MVFTFLLIASLTFFLMQTLPGAPFNDRRLSEAQQKVLNQRYGLDEPVAIQYFKYLGNVMVGELGVSFQFDGRAVTKIIGERIGVSAILGAQAMGLGLVLGGLLGIIAAVRHNTFMDYTAMIIEVLGLSITYYDAAGVY